MKGKVFLLRAFLFVAFCLAGCDSDGSEPSDPGDTTPPTVAVTAPQAGTEVAEVLVITVDAFDNEGVERIELWVGGSLEGIDRDSPWEFDWNTRAVDNGARTFIVKAFDAAGNEAETQPIDIEVSNVATVTFIGGAESRVAVTLSGGTPGFSLRRGERLIYSDPEQDSLSYEAVTGGFFPSRVEVGWAGVLDLRDGRNRDLRFDVSPSYALFALDNNSTQEEVFTLVFEYANGEEVSVFTSVPTGERVEMGYIPTDSLVEVHNYSYLGQTTWGAGTDFTLSSRVNQIVTLTYPRP